MNKDDTDIELPEDVIDRVNVGIIAVSLSLYEEGMDLEELSEVTGIEKEEVTKSLEFLMEKRMVKQRIGSNTYRVSNFKKMLQFLLSSGMIFPIGEQFPGKEEK